MMPAQASPLLAAVSASAVISACSAWPAPGKPPERKANDTRCLTLLASGPRERAVFDGGTVSFEAGVNPGAALIGSNIVRSIGRPASSYGAARPSNHRAIGSSARSARIRRLEIRRDVPFDSAA